MSEVTYDAIKPLIATAQQDGGSMRCTFKCAKTGVTADSSAGISHAQGLKATAVQSTKRNLWYSIRSAVSSLIYGQVGSNLAGRVANDVAYEAERQGQNATEYSGAEKNAAVVQAFNNVKDKFQFDEASKSWIGKKTE